MPICRRRIVHAFVVGLVVAVWSAVPAGAAPRVVAPKVVAPKVAAPALSVRVQGNTLVDGSGNPLRLLGVDRSGAEYACVQGWGIFDGPTDPTSIAAMAAWHINAVRIPLNEDCWLAINGAAANLSGAAYRSAIATYVASLHHAGLIVILDLHWNAPGTTPASQTGQQVMADADHSPAFWASVASYFKNDPAVVFDLYNEPHDISWSCWRDGCSVTGGWQTAGMQQLVNAVRSSGATQPVMLGGLGWSSDLSSWLTYRPTDPANQEAASFHVYNFSGCADVSCWSATVAPVAASVPVVTGEIGENDCASGFIASYMAWADAHGVSYLGWTWDTWDCSSGPALIANYDGTPTAFGAGYRDHLAALAAAPAVLVYPTPGQAGVDTTKPFTWTASTGAQNYYLVIGTRRYGTDLVNSGVLPPTQRSLSVPALPTGETLFATLFTEAGGTWYYRDLNFTAAPGMAMFTYPVNGQLQVDTTKPFTWSTIPAGQGYIMVVGAAPFGAHLVNSGVLPATQSSFRVPVLPAGKVLYATLLTKVNGAWTRYQAIAFTAR